MKHKIAFKLLTIVLFMIVNVVNAQISGTLDFTFNDTGIIQYDDYPVDFASDIEVLPDQKILVLMGNYSHSFERVSNSVIRYNSDGSLDTSFGDSGIVVIDIAGDDIMGTELDVLSDGRIIIGGDYGLNVDAFILGLMPDGSIDVSFGGDGGIIILDVDASQNTVGDLKITADDEIYVVTNVFIYEGLTILRYNSDGTLDTTFGEDGIVQTDFDYANAEKVAFTSDEKILVAGATGWPSGGTDVIVAKYNTDGSLDTTFGDDGSVIITPLTNYTYPRYLLVQPDNKIIIGGFDYDFSSDFLTSFTVRLNSDGTYDNSFAEDGTYTTDPEDNCILKDALLQDDGKIITTGESETELVVQRFQTNGLPDSSFALNSVFSYQADSMLASGSNIRLQADNKILIFGGVTNDAYTQNDALIIRLLNDVVVGVSEAQTNMDVHIYPNPASENITVTIPDYFADKLTLQVINIHGEILSEQTINKLTNLSLSIQSLPGGFYFIKLSSGGINILKSFLKLND
jgi:uncharacterized delta-60 repeat protein